MVLGSFGLLVAYADVCVRDRWGYQGFYMGPGYGTEPIPVASARHKSAYLPELPSLEVPDHCTKDKGQPLRLVEVRAGGKKLIFIYNHSIWLTMVKPRDKFMWFTFRGHSIGSVRGHQAEVTILGQGSTYYVCGTGFKCQAYTGTPTGHPVFPTGAAVRWLEKDIDFKIEGPVSEHFLERLADSMRLEKTSKA